MSQVFYNNSEIFPVPFVTHDVTPIFSTNGKRLGYAEKYVLNGLFTGCNFSTITGQINNVRNIFSVDFKNLELRDIGFTGIVSGAKINAINIENSSQIGVVSYTVELLAYPESFFETHGVLDKKNEWATSLSQNGEISTTHTVFAKGVNTSPSFDNALDNAKNFVLSQTGFTAPSLFPFFISGFSGKLDSRVENINRLDGTYQISETYIASTGLASVKTFEVNIESGSDGIINVSTKGSFKAGKAVDFNIARQDYMNFDSFSVASGAYLNYRGITGLISIPLSSGITEDQANNTISFDVLFTDFPTVKYRHIFDTQVTSGIDSIITASVNGRVEGLGRQNVRYDNAYNFFTGLNIFAEVNEAFKDYVGAGYPYQLNAFPTESGNSLDRFNGVIGYSATFNNKTPIIQCSGIKFFDVTWTKQYAMRQISPISIPHSIRGIDSLDLDFSSRGTVEVNGSVTVDKGFNSIDATGAVRQFINGKFRREILSSGNKSQIRLESVNLNQSVNTDTCSFSVTYSFNEPLATNPPSDYLFITGLSF